MRHVMPLLGMLLLLPACEFLMGPTPPLVSPPPQTSGDSSEFADVNQTTFLDASAPMAELNPQSFPPMAGEMAIGNTTGAALTVRVRGLRPTVQMDCAQVAKSPKTMLARALFQSAQTWRIDSGRAIGVGGHGAGCTALLVDGGGLEMRLLFWMAPNHPPGMVESTVAGADPQSLLKLQVAEGGVDFAPRGEVLLPPPVLEPGPAPGCGQPDAKADLAWSLPVPLGDQTILTRYVAPDGCMQLSLLGKLGISGWTLCLPPGAFPFVEGDGFFVAALTGGHNLGAIDGFELVAPTHKLRFGRGDDLVYFGPGKLEWKSVPGCGGAHDACGNLQAPLFAQIAQAGDAELLATPGQQVQLASGGQLHVIQASSLPVLDSQCVPGVALGQRHVQSVFTQKLGVNP